MAHLKSFRTNLKESKFCGKISREIPQVGSCTASLHNLHWLPVSSRMDYKISTLCLNTFTKSSPVHNAQLLSTHLPDTSVHPRIRALSIFLSSKPSHLVKEHSPLQAQLSGTYCLMDSDTLNLLLHLQQLTKPIFPDLLTNLLYLLDVVHPQQIAL